VVCKNPSSEPYREQRAGSVSWAQGYYVADTGSLVQIMKTLPAWPRQCWDSHPHTESAMCLCSVWHRLSRVFQFIQAERTHIRFQCDAW